MAELMCSMVCALVGGDWSWIPRSSAGPGVRFRRCLLPMSHDGIHRIESLPPHPTCIVTTTIGDLPKQTYVCGQDCPRPATADPERDRRRAAYRRREHARIVAAFDRFLTETYARPEEDPYAIYDECLNGGLPLLPPEFCGVRVGHKTHTWSDYGVSKNCDGVSDLQHKSHYGVHPVAMPPYGAPGCDCPLPEKVSEDCPIHGTPHNADYDVPPRPILDPALVQDDYERRAGEA